MAIVDEIEGLLREDGYKLEPPRIDTPAMVRTQDGDVVELTEAIAIVIARRLFARWTNG